MDTYGNAIERACLKAGVPFWQPNQLQLTRFEPAAPSENQQGKGQSPERPAASTPPAPLALVGGNLEVPPVDDEDLSILRALEEATPRLLTRAQIASGSHVSERTISKRMPKLLDARLAVQPNGPHSGTTIGEAGKELLARIDRAKYSGPRRLDH